MPLRQYDPAIARFTAIDPVTHYYQSTYTAFDDNPVYYADPSGALSSSLHGASDEDIIEAFEEDETGFLSGVNNLANNGNCPDGCDTVDGGALDEVIITAKGRGTSNDGEFDERTPDHIRYGNFDFVSDTPGTLEEYNVRWGTNYTNDNLGGQYYYRNFYAPERTDMLASMDQATGDAAEALMYVLPTGPGAVVGGVKGLPVMLKGLNKGYKFVDDALVFSQLRGNLLLHDAKLGLIKNSYGIYNSFSKGIRRNIFPIQNAIHRERNVFRNILNPQLPGKINDYYTLFKRTSHFFK